MCLAIVSWSTRNQGLIKPVKRQHKRIDDSCIGYKVFVEQTVDNFVPPYMGAGKDGIAMEIGKTYKSSQFSPRFTLGISGGLHYPAGFHVFALAEDAWAFWRVNWHFKGLYAMRVLKVRMRLLVAAGYEIRRVSELAPQDTYDARKKFLHTNFHATVFWPTLVAREMTLLEQLVPSQADMPVLESF